MNTNTKPWYQSKTVWFNILTGLVMIIGVLPANKYTVGGMALLNLLLRAVTSSAISLS